MLARLRRNWNPHSPLAGTGERAAALQTVWQLFQHLSPEPPHDPAIAFLAVNLRKTQTRPHKTEWHGSKRGNNPNVHRWGMRCDTDIPATVRYPATLSGPVSRRKRLCGSPTPLTWLEWSWAFKEAKEVSEVTGRGPHPIERGP